MNTPTINVRVHSERFIAGECLENFTDPYIAVFGKETIHELSFDISLFIFQRMQLFSV